MFYAQFSGEDQPVILVGGGSVLVDLSQKLKGASKVLCPPYYQVKCSLCYQHLYDHVNLLCILAQESGLQLWIRSLLDDRRIIQSWIMEILRSIMKMFNISAKKWAFKKFT